MRTAEAIYEEATLKNLADPNGTRMDIIIAAINAARKEAIEECAYRAKATAEWHRGRFTGNAYVDKQSILNLLNELK